VLAEGVAHAEEVADGNLHAGVRLPIPIYTKQDFAQIILVLAGYGDPNVGDTASTLNVGQDRGSPLRNP